MVSEREGMKRARLIRCVEWGIAEEIVYEDGSRALDCRLLRGACRGLECTIPDALQAMIDDPEKMLVPVPKDIKVLSGYRSVDDFMSASVPVGFWQEAWGEWRGDMSSTLDLEAEEKPLPNFADVLGIFNNETGANDESI